MSIAPTLLVLAAGMGSRYGGLKQLDGVGPNGEPILEYSVYDALRAGFGKLVFVIRPDFVEAFKANVTQKFADQVPIEYVYQTLEVLPESFTLPPHRQKPWGTAHAILCAEQAINEPFVSINADDFYGAAAYQKLGNYLRTQTDLTATTYAMVGYVLRNTLSDFGSVARGVCESVDSYLHNINELTNIERAGNGAKYTNAEGQIQALSGDELVSMNIWGFTPAIFKDLHRYFAKFLEEQGHEEKSEFYIPMTVGHLVKENEATVKVLASNDPWFGVTYQDDKPHVIQSVQNLIDQNLYPKNLWS